MRTLVGQEVRSWVCAIAKVFAPAPFFPGFFECPSFLEKRKGRAGGRNQSLMCAHPFGCAALFEADRKSTRLNLQSRFGISYAVFCLKKKKNTPRTGPSDSVPAGTHSAAGARQR